jgi:hypothetical protein
MGCGVVYAIVPLGGKSLQDVVQEQAQAVAREQLGRVSHTMRLEEQGLNATQERRQFDRFVESLLSGSRRNLWR